MRRAVGKLPRRFLAWLIDILLYLLLAKAIWIGLAKAGVIEPSYFLGSKYLLAELGGAIVWWGHRDDPLPAELLAEESLLYGAR